ncbi:MAG: FAD-dependent oxidoreductase [Syntrophorhabdales bacterium]|jgi:2,4-dienoyl-CoA reductase-like NADH-dependent reductase (Old Yellow Enzyme family)/thioredoxin reductase
MGQFQKLFSPVKIGRLEVKNRFVVPSMATNLANVDGTVDQRLCAYWTARAKGGFGLLMVEFTAIDPLGRVGLCHPGIWSDEFIPGMRELTQAVHHHGARIALQIAHTGRQTFPAILAGAQPVSASPIPCPVDRAIPRQLSTEEIYRLVEKFGDAAVRAQDAGFDAVEIHGAHGYLIAQFMSSYSNKRIDEFGGSLDNRMRFPLAIIRGVRERLGPAFPLLFRMSGEEKVPGGRTIDESRLVARMAEEAGIDAIDVSVGVSGAAPYIFAPPALPPGFLLQSAEQIKKSVSVPVIAVGRINHPLLAEDAIESGKADLIAWGRSSLADPELPNKIAAGRLEEIAPCISCSQGCIRNFPVPGKPLSTLGVTCLVNPFCGYETEMQITPARQPKKVVVVGGGPAGLEAAWVAAARGHRVTLYEKNKAAGGQYRIGAIPPFKQDIARALRYYLHMCEKHGVILKMGTEATVDEILAQKPDAVILATGGEPLIPDIPGAGGDRVALATDILEGKKAAGLNVLIVGGGMVGCEVADFLGEHLHKVTLVEMLPEVALDVPFPIAYFLLKRLKDYNVRVETETSAVELLKDGALVKKNGETRRLEGFDTIVLAVGTKSVDSLKAQLAPACRLHVIGDARAPRKAIDAIAEGAAVALKL